jgi:MFS family permease
VLAFVAVLKDSPAVKDVLPKYTFAIFLDTFWVNPRKYPDFAWTWFSRLWMWLGIATFGIYQVLYLEVHLHKQALNIPSLLLTITLVGSGSALIAAVIGGRLSDILRRRKAFVVLSGLLYATGLVMIASTHSWDTYLIAVGIHGAGEGIFLGVDLAIANDVLPSNQTAAHDLGVLNIAQALPQALAPTFAPVLLAIDGPNNYVAVALACAVFCTIGGFMILAVRRIR